MESGWVCPKFLVFSLFHEMRRISMKDQIKQNGQWTCSIFTGKIGLLCTEDRFFLLIYLISLSSLKQNSLNQDFRSSNLKIYHWQTETLRTQENMQLVKQRLRQIISKQHKNQLRNKTVKQKNCETRQISNWSRQEHFFTHHKPELLTETNKR